jgi:tRNA dimethylallyltransferase
MQKQIIFVIGSTSSGKTDKTIQIAKDFGFLENSKELKSEIIGADSRQIFRDFNLTTGKVTKEELLLEDNIFIKHHLIDIINPGEYFSVVDFQKLCISIVENLFSQNKIPIICGGTGQFIDSIFFDQTFPKTLPNLEFREKMQKLSCEELFLLLQEKDKNRAEKIDKNNKVRIIRSLEILEENDFVPEISLKERFSKEEFLVKVINMNDNFDRKQLRERIEKRLKKRFEEGMIEEVKNVKEKYNLSSDYLESLGLEFRYISQFLDGKISYDLMFERLVFETRKYAKRQETWFKKYKNNF